MSDVKQYLLTATNLRGAPTFELFENTTGTDVDVSSWGVVSQGVMAGDTIASPSLTEPNGTQFTMTLQVPTV